MKTHRTSAEIIGETRKLLENTGTVPGPAVPSDYRSVLKFHGYVFQDSQSMIYRRKLIHDTLYQSSSVDKRENCIDIYMTTFKNVMSYHFEVRTDDGSDAIFESQDFQDAKQFANSLDSYLRGVA